MLLLGGEEDLWVGNNDILEGDGTASPDSYKSIEELALLEAMVRAFSRNKTRLKEINDLVKRLANRDGGDQVVPPEFLDLWKVFESALSE